MSMAEVVAGILSQQGGVVEFNVLVVVGNSGTPSTADQKVIDWLDARDGVASVTVLDDGATEEDTSDGHDVVIIAPEAAAAGAKYRGDGSNPIPWIDMEYLSGSQQTDRERTTDVDTDFNWGSPTTYYTDDTEITWTGETLNTQVTLFSSSTNFDHYSGVPADGLVMCADDSGESHAGVISYEAGDTMDGAVDTAVRGVACCGIFRPFIDADLTAAGTQLLDDIFDWVAGVT